MRKAVWEESILGMPDSEALVPLHRLDPLKDPRWNDLLERHPAASVFHSTEWLEALRRTYGYESMALTTSPPGQPLKNGLVFCRIESWMTGRRLVSRPFSDYCEPLTPRAEDISVFLHALREEARTGKWRYIEIRPLRAINVAG